VKAPKDVMDGIEPRQAHCLLSARTIVQGAARLRVRSSILLRIALIRLPVLHSLIADRTAFPLLERIRFVLYQALLPLGIADAEAVPEELDTQADQRMLRPSRRASSSVRSKRLLLSSLVTFPTAFKPFHSDGKILWPCRHGNYLSFIPTSRFEPVLDM